jgi:cytochrome c peroxidase
MLVKRVIVTVLVLGIAVTFALPQYSGMISAASLSPIEELGKKLFFDQNLSKNGNQSCASCHDPATGFSGADSEDNETTGVYPGSDPSLFGNRKPPTVAYLGDSPPLTYDESHGEWIGGSFFDGRATGEILGDPLAEQAKVPFLNPFEMALSSAEELRGKVKEGSYTDLFEQVWGAGSLDGDANEVYDQIGLSIAAYERSAEVNPYSSKFDRFWDKANAKGLDVAAIGPSNWEDYTGLGLSKKEILGLLIFNRPGEGNCAACHSLTPGPAGYPLFTDYSYANVGLPKNPQNPFYANSAHNPAGEAWVDQGLGGVLKKADQQGKIKVPTLRNVAKRPYGNFVKSYGHNGYFRSLEGIVDFYAWGAEAGGRFGIPVIYPEVGTNMSSINRFSNDDQKNVLAFLKTLSDGYRSLWFS